MTQTLAQAAAQDADILRNDPASVDSVLILVRQGEILLARMVLEAERDHAAASRVVEFLVDQRPGRQVDPANFDFVDMEEPLGSAVLEGMIARAKVDRDEAADRLTAVLRRVAAVARCILDSVPGAEFADLGVA